MVDRNRTLTVLSEAIEAALKDIVREVVREEVRAALAESERGENGSGSPGTMKTYLTVKQAAELSRLGSSTIRLYIRKRKLKAYKQGRRVIIKRAELESFLEAHPIEMIPD